MLSCARASACVDSSASSPKERRTAGNRLIFDVRGQRTAHRGGDQTRLGEKRRRFGGVRAMRHGERALALDG